MNYELRDVPPQELEAEEMVLGACILEPSVISSARVRAEDFYKSRHQVIFRALLDMTERGEQVDLVTLTAAVRDKKEFENVGAGSVLSGLLQNVATSANFRSHEQLVINAAQKRRVIKACREAEALCYLPGDHERIIGDAIMVLNGIRRHEDNKLVTYRDMIMRGYDAVVKRSEQKGIISGIPMGLRVADDMTDGLQRSEMVILAGRPGMGKTALGMQIMRHAAQLGRKAGIVSVEMGESQVAMRELSSDSGVGLNRMRSGYISPDDWDSLTNAAGRLAPLQIHLAFESFTDRNIERVIDDMVQRLGCEVVMLDYVQLVGTEENTGNREQEVSKVSRMLKRKAKEHRIPVLVLAQLNRQLENRPDKRPVLADLRESGSLEQDADVIMFIYRDDVYNCKCPKAVACACGKRGTAELLIRKGRMIMTGDVHLTFDGRTTTFRDAN